MADKYIASEALFSFCVWLTARKERTILSSTDSAIPISNRIQEFCDKNELNEPRENWQDF